MKKLILVSAAIAIGVCAYTQTDAENKKMSSPDISNTNDGLNQNRDMNNDQNQYVENNPVEKSHPDGVMMQNGKMMKVKNGKTTAFDNEMTMSNGTKIKSDGTYIKKDGTKSKLKEGEHMDMSGNMLPMKTNKDKNMQHDTDSTKKKNK